MKNILIKETKDSPQILLDAENGKMIIRGHSYPENSFVFYEDVLNWLRDFFEKTDKKLEVEIDLDFYNFSTAQTLFNFFDLFDEYKDKIEVIKWYHDGKDGLMYENYQDFAEEFKDLNIIPVEKKEKN